MAEFRFRAAAALELRTQEERDAARAVGEADAALREAIAARDGTSAERQAAQQRLVDAERGGTAIDTLLWHRNWITRLQAVVTRLAFDVERRAAAKRDAERIWQEARRRRRALERLRDRAHRRFTEEQARQENKAIDELARLRFTQSGGSLDLDQEHHND